MKENLYIINPVAGRGNGQKVYTVLNPLLDKNNEDILLTEYKGHIRDILPKIKNKYNVFCVVGGDGTLNEVLNGLSGGSDKTVGLIPCGSGNDFSKVIGLNKSLYRNLDIVRNKKIKDVDVARFEYCCSENLAGSSYFINGIGIGFDALVADLIKTKSILSGLSLYLVSVFKALVKYLPIHVDGYFDGQKVSGEKILIAIGNGKFSGGGFKLNPDAQIDDGYLDACIIDNLPKLEIIKKLPLAISGKHISLPITKMIKFKKAEINLKSPYYIHADGEVIGKQIHTIKIEIQNKIKMITK